MSGPKKKQLIPVWSWRHAIEVTDVPCATKAVCYTISNYLSDAGKSWDMTLDIIERGTGLSKRAVVTHIQNAEKAGLLATEPLYNHKGHRYCTRFTARFPDSVELDRKPAELPNSDKSLSANPAPRKKHIQKSLRANKARLSAPIAPQDLSSSFPDSVIAESQRIKTTSAAASSRAHVREAAADADQKVVVFSNKEKAAPTAKPAPILDLKATALTPAQTRKAGNKAVALQQRSRRQPQMALERVDASDDRVLLDQQVMQGFTSWFDAMDNLWAGTRVSTKQRGEMRQLIKIEGLDYVLAIGEALKGLQFGKGQGNGWVVELTHLLTQPDKRDKVFGQYKRASLIKTTAIAGTVEKPDRFNPNKPAAIIHKVMISGEDANDILDAIPGATRGMVREALKGASAKKPKHFDPSKNALSDDKFCTAQLKPILDWVTTEVGWAAAYARHGTPEELLGEPAAEGLSSRKGAVAETLITSLKDRYAYAYGFDHPVLGRIGRDYGFSPENAFSEAANGIKPNTYGPVSQKALADAIEVEFHRGHQLVANEIDQKLAERADSDLVRPGIERTRSGGSPCR